MRVTANSHGLHLSFTLDVDKGTFTGFEDDICMGLTDAPDLAPQDSGLKLFPNPAVNQIYLQWNAAGHFVQGQLFNTNGQAVRTFNVQGQQATVGLNGLPSGLYLVQLRTGEGRQVVRKLIKE